MGRHARTTATNKVNVTPRPECASATRAMVPLTAPSVFVTKIAWGKASAKVEYVTVCAAMVVLPARTRRAQIIAPSTARVTVKPESALVCLLSLVRPAVEPSVQ
jgi:hypothetical protein